MGKNDFDINLVNCRNVKCVEGDSILIKKNALNVFYGKNGTGKTTLGKALDYAYEQTDAKKQALSSYRYLETGDSADEPSATCAPRIKRLLVFNDEWVNAHCFDKSTVHQNAFELYVRDSEVRKLEKRKQRMLSRLTAVLGTEDVANLRNLLDLLYGGIGKLRKDGTFAANAPTVKAFEAGVPTEPIPKYLTSVVLKMNASEKAKWLEWRAKRPVVHDGDICPYCGNKDRLRVEACTEYDESRDSSAVKLWARMASAFDAVGVLLSRPNRALMSNVLGSKKAPSSIEIDRLAQLSYDAVRAKAAIDGIANALADERCANAKILVSTLQEHVKVLDECKIFLKTRDGKPTNEAKTISDLAKAAEGVVSAQASLEKLSNTLVGRIAANIEGHESEINQFLLQCGYRYKIKIESNPQISEARMLLVPLDSSCVIEDARESLSYGERNALALILFMFEVLHEQRPLAVLDDPVSSFDYDKRYGVLYALFAKGGPFSRNLRGESVLVMTHDFLVVSDLIKLPGQGLASAKGQFLSCDAKGVLRAVALDKSVVVPYTQLLRKQIEAASASPEIIQLIYVRNLCELLRKNNEDRKTRFGWTFCLLSEIVHGREEQAIIKKHNLPGRKCRQVIMCENCVEEFTGQAFDFWKAVDCYSDCNELLVNIYESEQLASIDKLHVVRLLIERDSELADGASIMKRFADESCHIGGSYLYQMDGRTYDQVPFYVVDWCDTVVAKAKAGLASSAKA